MLWLIVIIISYLFFALSSLGDKVVLAKSPKPENYIFYVGLFSGIAIFLLPFGVTIPNLNAILLIIINGLVYIFSLYALFSALERFDVSKVVPTVGATQPIFVLLLTYLFVGPQELGVVELIAYFLLFIGSIVISVEKNEKVTGEFVSLSFLASFLFSLNFILSKFIFVELENNFVSGMFWMSMAACAIVLVGLVFKGFRRAVFEGEKVETQTGVLFVVTQIAGGIANLTQNYAVNIVPFGMLAIMNSIKGVQYVFLFLITLVISTYFPKILKENFSKRVVIQKIASIILIVVGLAILAIFVK
jgi:drug/metabolite transporter (DMT)-like permease